MDNQSGFKTGNLCTKLLVSTTHRIYKSFHDRQEVFVLDKAFDKIWHKGLTFKLKKNVVSDNLSSTLIDFFKLRKHRILLNSQMTIVIV